MSFLDDLNNAQENRKKREDEEKRRREDAEKKEIEACVRESYEELKRVMLDAAEYGKKSVRHHLHIRSFTQYRIPVEDDYKQPNTFGQFFTKKYGVKRLVRSGGRTEYLYLPFFPYEIIQDIESMLKKYLEADGITRYDFRLSETIYTDGKGKIWNDPKDVPAAASVVYQPALLVEINW